MAWKTQLPGMLTPKGLFSVKSAYALAIKRRGHFSKADTSSSILNVQIGSIRVGKKNMGSKCHQQNQGVHVEVGA